MEKTFYRMLPLLIGTLLSGANAFAETYIAGMVGPTFPQALSNIDVTTSGLPPGTTSTNLPLKTSVMYGGKIGHYFSGVPWLGIETEAYTTTPHLKAATSTVSIPGFGDLTGQSTGGHFRVTTWAFNVLARYPGEKLQPYAGVGVGVFFARLKDPETGESTSDTAPGLNALAGLRYQFTDWFTAFAEWKFNHARFHFPETPNNDGFNADYNVHHAVAGIAVSY